MNSWARNSVMVVVYLVLWGTSLWGCSEDKSTANSAGTGGSYGLGGSGSSANNGGYAGSSAANSGGTSGSATGPVVGTFLVQLVEPNDGTNGTATEGSTTVLGKVYDGETLNTVIWETSATEGDCTLYKPRVPFCNTPCGGSAACVEDDTCQDYPLAHSVGTVTMTGLVTTSGDKSFEMKSVVNNYQPPAGVSLPYPAFDEGDSIGLEASGDYYPAFSITGKGIAPLALITTSFALDKSKDFVLEWTPPSVSDISTITVKLDISHHGGTKGKIECKTEDNGSLTISAALLNELIDLGVAGYPSIVVTRQSSAGTSIEPGVVQLVIASNIEKEVTVDGLTSCTDNSQCPDGQTCQSDLSCQ